MNQAEDLYLLSFGSVMQVIDLGLAQLPYHVQWSIDRREYVLYMLEWLSVKITDVQAETAVDLGVAYLKRHNVPEEFASTMSYYVMEEIYSLITSTFVNTTLQSLSTARYVLENEETLKVYLKRPTHA